MEKIILCKYQLIIYNIKSNYVLYLINNISNRKYLKLL